MTRPAGLKAWAVPVLLFLATTSFALATVLPLLQVDRLYFFTDQPSLVAIVAGLWKGGDPLLAVLVGLVSIVFPASKLLLLHLRAYAGQDAQLRLPAWLRSLSRWSMLDVVLVALVIFAAKTSGLAVAFARPGLWLFATSVVLTAWAAHLLEKRRGADGG